MSGVIGLTTVVYPGSFDPITYGHLDIIERAATLFDQVVVAVFANSAKRPLFTVAERVELARQVTTHLPNVRVEAGQGLVVEHARRVGAMGIVKGLRALQDFEYEFQMGLINKQLAPELETLFLMSRAQYSYLSSSIVKELAHYGADLSELVPPPVAVQLQRKNQPPKA